MVEIRPFTPVGDLVMHCFRTDNHPLYRNAVGRSLAWLAGLMVASVLLATLPMGALTPTAEAAEGSSFDGEEIKNLCTIRPGAQSCPAFPGPPGLLNPGALEASGPEVADSMRNLEAAAIFNTLADHQLPAGDRDAVASWGRSDAQAELWTLIVDALKTPEDERTADQQNAAVWMTDLATTQANEAALQAGAEYATFAGRDVNAYWNMARGASQSELFQFLKGEVLARSPQNTPRGGYCNYKPPAPNSTEYDGSTTPTCFGPCQNEQGCPFPTPTYDQFVTWGESAATYPLLTDPAFATQAVAIGAGATFGVAAASVGIAAAILTPTFASALASSASQAIISMIMTELPASTVPTGIAFAASAAALLGTIILAGIVAVVYAVTDTIRVTRNANLPYQLAELVVLERSELNDASPMINTTDGATALYNLFVGATLPRPRWDVACDNSLFPPWYHTASFDPNLIIYVPLGYNDEITTLTDRSGCLNPPPIPPAGPTDPQFVVTHFQGSGVPVQSTSPTITLGNTEGEQAGVVRVHGNWFIQDYVQYSEAAQSLRLTYLGWDGQTHIAWLNLDDSGRYRFIGVTGDGSTTLDLDTCVDDDSCFELQTIHYLGPDRQLYAARLEAFQPPLGGPSYSPSAPIEGSPVTFNANNFTPGNSTSDVTYSWRFQRLGCGWLECLLAGQVGPDGKAIPSYSEPVTGRTATYTWQSIGPAKVQLTATDSVGRQAVTTIVVNVGNAAPTVVLDHDALTQDLGQHVTLTGEFADAGDSDDENVVVTWGDGQQDSVKAGPNSINVVDGYRPTAIKTDPTSFSLSAEHTYSTPGTYYGTVAVSDWGGATDSAAFIASVKGTQQITFPSVGDQTYGQEVAMQATGTFLSGVRVTYSASPDEVCVMSDTESTKVKLVGVGDCTVTANQAANPPLFSPAPAVARTFHVNPAPLRISGPSISVRYGEEMPEFLPVSSGLLMGDDPGAIADEVGLTVTGPSAGSPPGIYPIKVSGTKATAGNYAITYVDGTLLISKGLLTITAKDKTKVYGADDPELTTTVEGLLADDSAADLRGVQLHGAPTDADAGSYPITVTVDSSSPLTSKYDIKTVAGTETITPAPLTVTAADQTKVYGADDPAFTATADGLVNGDTKADLTGLTVAGPPTDSDAGTYSIKGSGITNHNYDVTYLDGTERITPAPLRITADDQTKAYGADDPTYTASYDGLVNGDTPSEVTGLVVAGPGSAVGVGTYPIAVSGGTSPNYAITSVYGTEKVTPAPLRVTADDKTGTYGGADPELTASVDGLVNGDTRGDLPGLVVRGAPSGSNAGTYPIVVSGIDNPNYEVAYVTGTQTIKRAPLRITADDKTKVYGADDPSFTASYDGLVNGDQKSAITGLRITGPRSGSDVGTHPIVPSDAANPNYEVTFVNGTETITPAALRITAADQTVASGKVATYSWAGSGWVNGDSDATLGGAPHTPPICSATVAGSAASASTAPGTYPGAITCADARDGNYTISYAAGKLTVDPVITLAQTGLPATLPRQVTLDGTTSNLPVTAQRVAYGTAHSYRFPTYVPDTAGVLYITTTPAFSGPVAANINTTATYRTMQQSIAEGVTAKTIDSKYAPTLTNCWATVEKQIKAAKTGPALTALHDYATAVRSQSGKKVAKATADNLIAMAQAVYASYGGTGAV